MEFTETTRVVGPRPQDLVRYVHLQGSEELSISRAPNHMIDSRDVLPVILQRFGASECWY